MNAFPHDPDFPQLEIASDPLQMLELFRSRLTPVAGRSCAIETCVPFRFRCRQSSARLVLQYTLGLIDRVSGRRWDQWVTCLVYAAQGEAERLWHELRASDPHRDIPPEWLVYEPVDFVPELGMLVQVFPYDRKLPHLAPVLNGALHELDPRLLVRLGRERGGWRVKRRTIEPTRYRTELGAALRYTVCAAHDQGVATACCYVKVYRDDRGAETARLLEGLASGPARVYDVVRPITYLPDLRTLCLEEAAGTPLQRVLLARRDSEAALRSVAHAVAAFHRDAVPTTRRYGLADQLDDVRRAAALLGWACPDVRAESEAIAADVARTLGEVPATPLHRDLKPDHIFLAADRVTFIDLDSVALGDPVSDPAHLFAHIVGRVGLDGLTADEAGAAARVFSEEYFRQVTPEWRDRFGAHCAGALLEVARGIFKRQEPTWPSKVRAAVQEARRVLSR